MKLKEVFGEYRICGLAGDKSTGKTNNLMALIKDFRKHNKTTKIYVYGLDSITLKWLKQLKEVYEISSLNHLSDKKDSLIIIDEYQKLNLNNRRYKLQLDKFADFIYHNNNWVILCSPNLREYNSVIGSKIERWMLKTMKLSSLVNGSQLKEVVNNYNGSYKQMDDIVIPKDSALIINDDYERVITLEYIKEIDNKKENVNIFFVK